MSLPYEPARPAFASLRRTAEDLAALAGERIEELGAAARRGRASRARAPRAHACSTTRTRARRRSSRARSASSRAPACAARSSSSARRCSSCSAPEPTPEQIALVCPSLERWRAPVETAFGTLGIPYAFEAPLRAGGRRRTATALLSLLRYAWLGGDRRGDLFAYLRSPYSGLPRHNVDFLEGRLRGRAIATRLSVWRRAVEALQARGARARAPPAGAGAGARAVSRARGRDAPRRPRPGGAARRARPRGSTCARTRRACACSASSAGWERLAGEPVSREDVVAALERATVRGASPGRAGPRRRPRPSRGHARAASRPSSCSGWRREPAAPRRGSRRSSTTTTRRRLGARLERAGPGQPRPLPLLHGLRARDPAPVPRPRGGRPTRAARASRARSGRRSRRCSTRTTSPAGPVAERSPRSRGRSRRRRASASGCARSPLLASDRDASDDRRRARPRQRLGAAARPGAHGVHTRDEAHGIRSCCAELAARTSFNVTELERFADCSSAWFFDRVVDPKTIDAGGRREAARLGRAHGAAPLLRAACRRSSAPTRSSEERARRGGPVHARLPGRGARAACGWR